jgi:hypothetical protein
VNKLIPEIHIPAFVITALQVILAFSGAFLLALWLSLVIWTFRDVRSRSRDVFAIMLATLMVFIFGPLGLILYFLLRPPVTLAELYERSLEEEALLQDLEERPRCPGCSRQVNEAWIICPDCHTTLKKICPQCEKSLQLRWNICPYCGTRVAVTAPPVDSGRPDPAEPRVFETQPMVAPAAYPEEYEPPRHETRPHAPQARQARRRGSIKLSSPGPILDNIADAITNFIEGLRKPEKM